MLVRSDDMIEAVALPHPSSTLQKSVDAIRRERFPTMEDSLKWNLVLRREDGVDMIRHDHPCVDEMRRSMPVEQSGLDNVGNVTHQTHAWGAEGRL
jgi:hypothetical protein